MAAKPIFNAEQQEIIRVTARKVYKAQFKPIKATKDHPGGQEAMALALGVTQQTISSLVSPTGKYNPGMRVASAIANLDGQTLEQLIGEFTDPDAPVLMPTNGAPSGFANLDVCIQFHSSTKHWSPWTIAAARSGFFGSSDFAAPEWVAKLDTLEKALERVRKI